MGLVNEIVLVELHGYLVIERSVAGKFHDYCIALGSRYKYKFHFRPVFNGKDTLGEQACFKDLTECESYFSGLITNDMMVKQLNERGQLLVSETVLPLMGRVRELFSQLK